MKKILKWISISVGGLVGLIVVVALIGLARANNLLTKEWVYTPEIIQIPTDAQSVTSGKYLVDHFLLCADCHGTDLGGAEFFPADDGAGVLWAPNLTNGAGGVSQTYTDADWIRALRHGIRPNGENLIIMPSEYYTTLGVDELAQAIAYLKALPPVDRETPARQLALPAKVMLGLGVVPAEVFLPPHKIDHEMVTSTAPPRGVTVEYGEYRALICAACHAENLAGLPGSAETGELPAPNLTPGGELASWDLDDFLTTLNTGVTPSGKTLYLEAMPWDKLGSANPDDLEAIWLYLQSLPSLPDNTN